VLFARCNRHRRRASSGSSSTQALECPLTCATANNGVHSQVAFDLALEAQEHGTLLKEELEERVKAAKESEEERFRLKLIDSDMSADDRKAMIAKVMLPRKLDRLRFVLPVLYPIMSTRSRR